VFTLGYLSYGARESYSNVLHLLHESHPGKTKMKSLVRLHVWWPGIDDQIENFVKACRSCSQNARVPIEIPLHLWELTAQASYRLSWTIQRQNVASSH